MQEFVHRVLAEDLGEGGDITSRTTTANARFFRAKWPAARPIVVAGLEVGTDFSGAGSEVRVEGCVTDGDRREAGSALCGWRAMPGRCCPRTAGAQHAAAFVRYRDPHRHCRRDRFDRCDPARHAQDHPRTSPAREYAARMGGAENHRIRLDDGMLIKDNHVGVCRGRGRSGSRESAEAELPVQVEVDRIEQIEAALEAGADRLLLDNMEPTFSRGGKLVAGRVPLEASGGVRLDTIRAIAESGVDFIWSDGFPIGAGSRHRDGLLIRLS